MVVLPSKSSPSYFTVKGPYEIIITFKLQSYSHKGNSPDDFSALHASQFRLRADGFAIRSENLIKPNIWGWELRSWKPGFEN
ncbi:hypothetical protein ACE6H2_003413 [Prunus campanulata]